MRNIRTDKNIRRLCDVKKFASFVLEVDDDDPYEMGQSI